ncbi:hypothetical protein OBBRIDRAFT_776091 [Obba rivulosa]|uniref:Uncharacterized protein n=1 Tax=Obba rivulosa TaxID=1052685 RepID=A0A8E2DME1_9APHY|nr:hypothetical protein OBBRIDRAFT_776091 [Obba rivulosa]
MPAERDGMTTQPPQSLPSFAQAFSIPTLTRISAGSNALPPIHSRSPQPERDPHPPSDHNSPAMAALETRSTTRKRLHAESAAADEDERSGSEDHKPPHVARIKEETDHDALSPPQPTPAEQSRSDSARAPSPSRPSSSKRRRVTITGISHPINTDVRPSSSDGSNLPISPAVMGLSIARDDPAAIEQMRSMLTVKQKQKALIEQRRGSTAGIVSTGPPVVNVVNPLATSDDRHAPSKPLPARRSPLLPGTRGGHRHSIAVPLTSVPHTSVNVTADHRHTNSSPHVVQGQQHHPHPHASTSESHSHPHPASATAATHALPPPPISFARRRAGRQQGGVKGKPADILISPRDPQADKLQPSVQSAPPVPRAGQSQLSLGKFSGMALPTLPSVIGSQSTTRVTSSRVPPTPTRLGMPRTAGFPVHPQGVPGGIPGRSPPNASIPIATTLVPPTPATLQHPGYTGERSAFLAPFELFYDALSDSKQLKNWLSEQLQKSHGLIVQLQRQQEHMEETVNALVDKRVAVMREEIYGLHRRVEELEHALRIARGPSYSYSPNMGSKGKAKANGVSIAPVVSESYTFPPVDPSIRRPEPIRQALSPVSLDRDNESRSFPGSPVPFDVGRRLSVSAIRMDPRSPAAVEASPQRGLQPPVSREREQHPHGLQPPGAQGRGAWSPGSTRAAVASSSSREVGHSPERMGLGRKSPARHSPSERHVTWEGAHESPISRDGRHDAARKEPAAVSPSRVVVRSPSGDA